MPGKATTVDTEAIFNPRAGSAQVIRYLLPTVHRKFGTRVRLLVGSLGGPGELSHAASFYRGIELFSAEYTDAVATADRAGTSQLSDTGVGTAGDAELTEPRCIARRGIRSDFG